MKLQKSQGHICFQDTHEYFWVQETTGRKHVARASIDNPLDVGTKQRLGGRFEGTEAWFQRFGKDLLNQAADIMDNNNN